MKEAPSRYQLGGKYKNHAGQGIAQSMIPISQICHAYCRIPYIQNSHRNHGQHKILSYFLYLHNSLPSHNASVSRDTPTPYPHKESYIKQRFSLSLLLYMYSNNKQEKSCNTYRFSISKTQSICGLPAFHKVAQSMHSPALRPIYFNSAF